MKILQKVDLKELYSVERENFIIDGYSVGIEIQLKAEDLSYLRSEPESFAIRNMILEKKNLVPYIVHAPFKDLSISSEDGFIRDYSIRNILGSIDFAHEIGVEKVVFHTGFPYCFMSSKIEGAYQRFKEAVETLLIYASKKKVTLIVENTYEQKFDLFEKIFSDFPQIQFALDIGHSYCFSKKEAGLWIAKFVSKIVHCHAHDNDYEEDLHLSLGKGKIPFSEIFEKIKNIGSVTLETPLNEMKENVLFLQKILGK